MLPIESTVPVCNYEDGWRAFNSHCYKFFQQQRTWAEAKTHCEALDSHLVTIHSKDENEFVLSLIAASGGGDIWMGANDLATDGTWVWVDGEDWGQYTNWGPDEPNGGIKEH